MRAVAVRNKNSTNHYSVQTQQNTNDTNDNNNNNNNNNNFSSSGGDERHFKRQAVRERISRNDDETRRRFLWLCG